MGEIGRESLDDSIRRSHDENYIPGIEHNHFRYPQKDETNT